MAYTGVLLPFTGAGDATATPAVDLINGQAFQAIKLFDATEGSTIPIVAKTSAPNAADPGMLVRQIGAITVANPTTAVTVDGTVGLASAGSTRLVGRVDVNNPTTAVSLSSQHTVTVGNPTTAVEANLSSLGSTRLVGKVDVNNPTTAVSLSSVHTVTLGNPTTAVEANLSSVGSTKLVGQVTVANPTTSVSLSSVPTVTVGNPTTAVTLTSGVVLGAGSTANIIGAEVISTLSWSSANIIGAVAQGPGSSANFWYSQPVPFSSDRTARTTVNTSVDASVIAANAARKALVIANLSTSQIVALGLSTGAVTTALANANLFLPPNSQLTFGYSGGMPLFTGPIRGINISSTAIGGGVAVMEFT